ncbi:MAG: cob(I)yrinic acid a,c-diamide adenosyltransferase [Patescibacteria group bacterium]
MLIIFYGKGKGKTSAALGVALRAAGWGKKVAIFQFVKGSWATGERLSIPKYLKPHVTIEALGKGFVGILDDKLAKQEHVTAAQAGLKKVAAAIKANKHNIIVLDEIIGAIHDQLITLDQVVTLLRKTPKKTDVILTGHYEIPKLIAMADMVSEVRKVKHPYDKGILAKQGIDF